MVGTPLINFVVEPVIEPKYLILLDLSEYYHIENSPAIVEIYSPGYTQPVTHIWNKKAINVFNSQNLGLNCSDCDHVDLADGIFTITVKGSPDSFYKTRCHLKADHFLIERAKVLTSRAIEYNPNDRVFNEWLTQLDLAFETAKSFCLEGDVKNCKRFFDEACELLDKYKTCRNCY